MAEDRERYKEYAAECLRIAQQTTDDARKARLLEMADRFGPRGLRLTQEELAGWVGASREAVARSLRQLRSAGVVRTGRQVVDVIDVIGLRNFAQTDSTSGANVTQCGVRQRSTRAATPGWRSCARARGTGRSRCPGDTMRRDA